MQTTNNPENQKNHPAHDLGQISKKTKTRREVINGINAKTMVDVEINYKIFGDLNLRNTYELINKHYEDLEDQYYGSVNWKLVVWGEQIVITEQDMPATLWFAYAENYESFRQWLKLFGWK